MGNNKMTVSDVPELLAEWDFEKNTTDPSTVAKGSNKKVWWICPLGHHYESSPNSRTNKHSGCKYCANKAVLFGFNDLSHTHPEIASEWDYDKNGNDSPDNYTAGSDKSFYWICNNGHESYPSSIKNRTKGKGCPICGRTKAGKSKTKTIIQAKGSIKDLFPLLSDEWDYEKNSLGPESFPAQSSEIVWWKCSWCNHNWQAKIAARAILNSGCPSCNQRNKTSFPEQAIFYYVKNIFSDAQNSFTEVFDNRMELDIYIPSLSIGIEYDGIYWHGKRRKEKDRKKYLLCKEYGITLLRIRESNDDASDICDEYIIRKDYTSFSSLDKAIIDILNLIGCTSLDISINSEKDRNAIKSQYIASMKMNSLQQKYPMIASEWHQNKNEPITPDMVSAHSQDIYWWKCSVCGNEYKKRISDRTCSGSGCNKCSSKKKSKWKEKLNLIPGVNDLATLYPELLNEWDYTQNTDISPNEVTAGSHKEVAWICQMCGNRWHASIYSRTQGRGCKKCGRKKAGESHKHNSIQKHGSLKEIFPDIAAQWDYEANEGVLPENVSPNDTTTEYHWICSCGTRWTSTVYNLTHSKYIGCRKCKNYQISQYRKEHPEANPFYGKQHSDETKHKIHLSSNGEKNAQYGKKGKLSPNYGKTFTAEHRAKISSALKGRVITDEAKAKMSVAKKGKMIGGKNPSAKRVRQLTKSGEVIAEYDSIKSAERSLGITAKSSKIGAVCRGERKSAYGYKWEYV